MPESKCLNGSPAPSPTTMQGQTTSIVSTAENIIARTLANAPENDALLHGRVAPRAPDTWLCRIAQCPDLAEGTTRAGRPLRTCRAAGNQQAGRLKRCPTGHLDRYYQAAEEKALGGRC